MLDIKKIERSLMSSFEDPRYDFLDVRFNDESIVDEELAMEQFRSICKETWQTVVSLTEHMLDDGLNNYSFEETYSTQDLKKAFFDKKSPLLNCWILSFVDVINHHYLDSEGDEQNFYFYMLGVMKTASKMGMIFNNEKSNI